MAPAPRALRNLSLNVIVEVDLSLEEVQEIWSAPPARLRRGMADLAVSVEIGERQIPPLLTSAHIARRGWGHA